MRTVSTSLAWKELNEVSESWEILNVSLSRYGCLGRSKPLYLVPSHSGFGTSTIWVSLRGWASLNGPLPIIMPLSQDVWSLRESTSLGMGKNSWNPATVGKFAYGLAS